MLALGIVAEPALLAKRSPPDVLYCDYIALPGASDAHLFADKGEGLLSLISQFVSVHPAVGNEDRLPARLHASSRAFFDSFRVAGVVPAAGRVRDIASPFGGGSERGDEKECGELLFHSTGFNCIRPVPE